MNRFRLALVQATFDPAPEAMANKYRTLVADAARAGARLVALPELSCTAYFPLQSPSGGEGDPLPENIPNGPSATLFAELAKENEVFVVGSVYERGGMGFRKHKGARFGTALLFDPAGRLGAACRRLHLPEPGHGNDADYFQKGNIDYPLFGLPDVTLALPTGYDAWFPELARIYALKGAELLVYPSANYAPQEAWLTTLRAHAVASGIFVAAANRVGTEGETAFTGSSVIVAPNGELLAQASHDSEEVVTAELDPQCVIDWRRQFPFLLRREPETYGVLMARLSKKES